ncbi:hypothetical protein [Halorussus ruber]|uniref:hypothetical protein n=1 Tax=Halorussus ruber TaxID=1126238 RepID=UPI0010927E2A|nr:hypothetical protein [Halorussus ruber]
MNESQRPPGSGPADSRRTTGRRQRSDDPESDGDAAVPREEKLLTLYENLRAEVRVRIRVANVRATRGIAVVGGVVGSAMVQSSFHLLALVPIVFGVLFVDTVRSYNEILAVARHLVELERDLAERGSPFQYEVRRGGAFGLARNQWGTFGWLSVANGARIIIFGGVYLGSWAVLLSYWATPPRLFGVKIGTTLLAVFAVGLSVFLLAVGLSHLAYRRRLSTEIESAGSGPSARSGASNSTD